MVNDPRRKREDLYGETRKDLLTRQLSNAERFDGAILSLSTGALGMSLIFIKDITPIEKSHWTALLFASWYFFGLAITSTVISFLSSQLAIKKQLTYAEEYYLNERNDFLSKVNLPAKITEYLNGAAGILFIMALASTILFVTKNIGGHKPMASEGATETQARQAAPIPGLQSAQPFEKGSPIPSMQPIPTSQPSPSNNQSGGGQPTGPSNSGKK